MTSAAIEHYLTALEEPKQATLRELRSTILGEIPDAEECISYGMPAFRVRGRVIAGFAAFKTHLSYFPHSVSVLPELAEELGAHITSKGTLQFGVDERLSRELVRKLIAIRLRQAFPDG